MATRSNLAVILHADVVGSTALVQKDERVAHERIQNSFRQLSEIIAVYGGVTHEVRGDALVAIFGRASDGLAATLAFQVANTKRNAELMDDIRPDVRVGIALGEVVVGDNTVTGPGVVLAQRIEQLAEPGGLCISAAVHEAVPRRLPVEFKSLGDQSVKGFDEPVRVYAVNLRAGAKVPEPVDDVHTNDNEAKPSTPVVLPDRPSIAVLPFNNLSDDPEQEYFADGMTEDIITGLSRFRSLLVIARNSTFAYKGTSPDVREVARDLGVRYVVEGSVRRVGGRIRITGQLVDAETGNHLWVERYDRELEDIFAVQDEVTEAIVAAIAPEIGEVERKRAQRKPPDSLDAWTLYQRGLAAYYSSTAEGLRSAIEQFDRVNEVDPTFAPAFAMAASARWRYVMHFEPVADPGSYLNQARDKANRAITLDPRDPTGLWNAARVHSLLGHHDAAITRSEDAVALNPNDAMSRYFLGAALCSAGRSEEAIRHIDHAIRLSPRDIYLTGMLTHRAFMLFDLERYDEALDWVQRACLSLNPRSMTFAVLAAVLTKLGRMEEARAAVDDLLAHAPRMSCAKYRDYRFGGPEAMERFVDALREAGLPE